MELLPISENQLVQKAPIKNESYQSKKTPHKSAQHQNCRKTQVFEDQDSEEFRPSLNEQSNYRRRRKTSPPEVWSSGQVRLIFHYYEDFGTHWSLLEKKFVEKTQNSIKNKFYGILKNLLRSLFREVGLFPGKKLRNLSANTITDIYDGRKDFKKYRGLLKRLLEIMNFQINRKNIIEFLESENSKISQLHEKLFGQKKSPESIQTVESVKQQPLQTNCLTESIPLKEEPEPMINSPSIMQGFPFSFPFLPQLFQPPYLNFNPYINGFYNL